MAMVGSVGEREGVSGGEVMGENGPNGPTGQE